MSTEVSRSSSIERSPSHRIAVAVADARDCEPTALEPLNSVVDPDALDALIADGTNGESRFPGRVSFTFAGCDVVVGSDGTVEVTRCE